MKKQSNNIHFSIIKVPTSMIEVELAESGSSQPLEQVEAEQKLVLKGELKLDDYILDVEPNKRTTEAVKAWVTQQRELTARNILVWLTITSVASVVASFFFVGVAANNQKVDKNFVKEVIPAIIGPQLTLLLGAFGTYVVRSKIQKKE